MINKDEKLWTIENFLMSCRVIGRKIETFLLNQIIYSAQKKGIETLQGSYIPSKKNKLVEYFYEKHGFEKTNQSNRVTLWKLKTNEFTGKDPKFIEVEENELINE